MTTGSGIFFGFITLCIILLYGFTKDRWRWRKLVTVVFGGFLILVAIFGVYGGVSYWLDMQPKVQDTFWDLKIRMPIDEVLFRKGQPSAKQDDKIYSYNADADETYDVVFADGRVKAVYISPKSSYYTRIQGISKYDSYEKIENTFGKPDSISVSSDKLARSISFSHYGVFFVLEKNGVVLFGIYDPELGPMKLKEEG